MNEPQVVDDDDPLVSMSIEKSGFGDNDVVGGADDKEQECDPASGECDLDDIGGLFGLTTSDKKESTQRHKNHHDKQKSRLDKMTPLDPTQWAYESGDVIEKGAVMLGGVDQEYGFGLRQQYFHKAAILVLDHDETTFTKGIILNRPTDLYLDDDINPGLKWRLWFGGDVQGLNSPNPDIVCLHSIKSKTVSDASVPVLNDIQWTTFENAKRLVQAGAADPEDFWVFCGESDLAAYNFFFFNSSLLTQTCLFFGQQDTLDGDLSSS